jgi:hypothetical protein
MDLFDLAEVEPPNASISSDLDNEPLNLRSLIDLMPRCWHLLLNKFTGYFFQYTINTSFANVIDYKMKQNYKSDLFVDQFFIDLLSSGSIGLCISRSSLSFIQIKKVCVLTLLQGINFVVLFCNAKYMFIENLKFLCLFYAWVGIIGGAIYVNILHNILELDSLRNTEKEMAISLCLMFNDLGILLASVTSMLLDNYYFKI